MRLDYSDMIVVISFLLSCAQLYSKKQDLEIWKLKRLIYEAFTALCLLNKQQSESRNQTAERNCSGYVIYHITITNAILFLSLMTYCSIIIIDTQYHY